VKNAAWTAKPLRLLLPLTLLAMAGGCATPTPPDVGAVVVAPKAKLPPVPPLILTVEAKPAGYFPNLLRDYFSASPTKPKASTTPTPSAAPAR
jgi:hypothetical protein